MKRILLLAIVVSFSCLSYAQSGKYGHSEEVITMQSPFGNTSIGDGADNSINGGLQSAMANAPAQKTFSTTPPSIHPNPVETVAKIDFDEARARILVEVLDLTGEVILQHEFHSRKSIALDMAHLRPGMYLTRITADGAVSTSKITHQ